jgi:hypothetical protein
MVYVVCGHINAHSGFTLRTGAAAEVILLQSLGWKTAWQQQYYFFDFCRRGLSDKPDRHKNGLIFIASIG